MNLGFVTSTPFAVTSSRVNKIAISPRRAARPHEPQMKSSLALPRPALVFVTPNDFSKDLSRALSLANAALSGGAALIQIRDRTSSPDDLLRVTEALLHGGIPPHKLVINGLSAVDVAGISSSLGLHVRESDIDVVLPTAVEILPDSVIGCAVHSKEAASRAAAFGVRYMQVGTMFATQSHPGKKPEGPGLLHEVREAAGEHVALIGIGGIDAGNVSEVMKAGADGVAVVSLLAAADDPAEAAAELMTAMRM